jgi:hypothetical protein
MTWAFNQSAKRKSTHAWEDAYNSPEAKGYRDTGDANRLNWAQNTLPGMTPAQREALVAAEIDKMYPTNLANNTITPSQAGQVDPLQAIQQHGSLFMPQDELDQYVRMVMERQRLRTLMNEQSLGGTAF